MFQVFNTAASGMQASHTWMEVISNNIANARTVQTPEGGPYRRQAVLFQELINEQERPSGVEVTSIAQENRPSEMRYEPGHPLADANGMVAYPAVDLVQEMGEMVAASRTYEANSVAMANYKAMLKAALDI